jgi:hypothetical protein
VSVRDRVREQLARDRAMQVEARRYEAEQRRVDRPSNGAAAEHRVQHRTRSGISFGQLVEALNARQSGENFMACCPGHADRNPSLSVRQMPSGKTVVHCFAGCPQQALIDIFVQRGLWPVEGDPGHRSATGPNGPVEQRSPLGLAEFDARLGAARKTVTDAYMTARGLDVGALADIQHCPRAYHAPTRTWWPAMVALIRDPDGAPRSVQRTFIGYGQPPQRAVYHGVKLTRMNWRGIPVKGCAIRLAAAGPVLIVGEGVETVASLMKMRGLPGWAAAGAGNLHNIELPRLVREVIVAADNDEPGSKAAEAAADRFRWQGRAVRVAKPKHVKDFNDLLLKRGKHAG